MLPCCGAAVLQCCGAAVLPCCGAGGGAVLPCCGAAGAAQLRRAVPPCCSRPAFSQTRRYPHSARVQPDLRFTLPVVLFVTVSCGGGRPSASASTTAKSAAATPTADPTSSAAVLDGTSYTLSGDVTCEHADDGSIYDVPAAMWHATLKADAATVSVRQLDDLAVQAGRPGPVLARAAGRRRLPSRLDGQGRHDRWQRHGHRRARGDDLTSREGR